VARKDLDKLQPMHEALQQLRHEGLTGANLLKMFFSRRIQPLRQRKTKMLLYTGPSCPNHPSSDELSAAEFNS
jgi:hypothetical protein